LAVALGAGIVGLRFLLLPGVVDNALVSGDVEEAVGGEEGDGLGDGGIDAEDVLELQDLLGDDGGDSS
jgi:hypothetical protein